MQKHFCRKIKITSRPCVWGCYALTAVRASLPLVAPVCVGVLSDVPIGISQKEGCTHARGVTSIQVMQICTTTLLHPCAWGYVRRS
jgi:hypothetical protein